MCIRDRFLFSIYCKLRPILKAAGLSKKSTFDQAGWISNKTGPDTRPNPSSNYRARMSIMFFFSLVQTEKFSLPFPCSDFACLPFRLLSVNNDVIVWDPSHLFIGCLIKSDSIIIHLNHELINFLPNSTVYKQNETIHKWVDVYTQTSTYTFPCQHIFTETFELGHTGHRTNPWIAVLQLMEQDASISSKINKQLSKKNNNNNSKVQRLQ